MLLTEIDSLLTLITSLNTSPKAVAYLDNQGKYSHVGPR
jgi:hypothetical protein